MTTFIFTTAIVIGIISPLLWSYFAWFKPAQLYLQMVILAAEQAIPDSTENTKLAKLDYILQLYIKYKKLDVEKDADAIASIRNAIELAIKGVDDASS